MGIQITKLIFCIPTICTDFPLFLLAVEEKAGQQLSSFFSCRRPAAAAAAEIARDAIAPFASSSFFHALP